jgi:hypothetical protein
MVIYKDPSGRAKRFFFCDNDYEARRTFPLTRLLSPAASPIKERLATVVGPIGNSVCQTISSRKFLLDNPVSTGLAFNGLNKEKI